MKFKEGFEKKFISIINSTQEKLEKQGIIISKMQLIKNVIQDAEKRISAENFEKLEKMGASELLVVSGLKSAKEILEKLEKEGEL